MNARKACTFDLPKLFNFFKNKYDFIKFLTFFEYGYCTPQSSND